MSQTISLPPPSSSNPISVHVGSAEEPRGAPFSQCIKDLRRRFGGKQLWLACLAGCTDAAVSFWETGKRVPNWDTFSKILVALAGAGVPPCEIETLRRSWIEAKGSQQLAANQRRRRTDD
jgi:DNA-binding XRE family transcriptional regulator